MKKLKTLHILLVLISSLLLTYCSPSEDDPNNTPPGLFSANALGTGINTGNVEWTESIDTDDDPVTYNIYLEEELIATGVTTKTYDFFGLEPDTGYDGYIEAQDGRGGTSRADFSFLTESEVIIFNVNASWWIFSETPESTGLRRILSAGFEVPFYEKATGYKIEIIDYAFAGTGRINSQDQNGKTYIWTNETRSDRIGPIKLNQDISEGFGVFIANASINTINPGYTETEAKYAATIGEAKVTVTIGK